MVTGASCRIGQRHVGCPGLSLCWPSRAYHGRSAGLGDRAGASALTSGQRIVIVVRKDYTGAGVDLLN